MALEAFEKQHAKKWAERSFGDTEIADAFLKYLESLSEEDYARVADLGYSVAIDDFEAWAKEQEK